MSLAETLTQVVTQVNQAWDEAGIFRIAIALIVPVIAWVIRKPVANLVFRLSKMIAEGVGFKLGNQLEESMRPAIEVFVVAFGALIAHESIQIPEPYFGIVGNLITTVSVAAVFVVVYSSSNFIPQFFAGKHGSQIPEQISWVVRIVQFLVVFVGIAAVFKVWGVDIGPVLTGMGLAGAAVSAGGSGLSEEPVGRV
jgi:MscS family membrane protein